MGVLVVSVTSTRPCRLVLFSSPSSVPIAVHSDPFEDDTDVDTDNSDTSDESGSDIEWEEE